MGFILLSVVLSSQKIVKSQGVFLSGYNVDEDDFLCVSRVLQVKNSHCVCVFVCVCMGRGGVVCLSMCLFLQWEHYNLSSNTGMQAGISP